MKQYKAVIFDLDGVLCNTDQFHYQAWKSLADREGILFDEEINNRLRGVSRMASMEIILERAEKSYTEAEKVAMAEYKNEVYKKLLLHMSPADLSDEVMLTLETLRKRGLKLAVGSSSKNTKLILRQMGIPDYFDSISDGTNITRSKPDPEVFIMAAEYLGEKPEDCLVVEDAKAGVLAAHRGGFDSAGIGEAAQSAYATWRLERISELLKVVGELAQ